MIQSKLREVAATTESATAELMLEAAEYIAELEAAIVSVGNALTELETDICKISAEIEPRLTKEQGEEVKSKVNEFVASMVNLPTEASQVGIGSHGDKEQILTDTTPR